MESVNIEHFKELLDNLSGETIKEIFADMRHVIDDKCGCRLPEPKNNSEKIAMEKFCEQSKIYVGLDEEFLSRPKVFPHLAE